MSSCFPISLSCFARRAVHYEAVSVSSGCSASLIKLGQGLISFSTWTEKNLHIWCKGHFVLLALSAECTSVACWFFIFLFVTASMSVSPAFILSSLSHSAGNSKQALRCKTCKMAAHLWCTSELSQQPCHGKVRNTHTKSLMLPSFIALRVSLSIVTNCTLWSAQLF